MQSQPPLSLPIHSGSMTTLATQPTLTPMVTRSMETTLRSPANTQSPAAGHMCPCAHESLVIRTLAQRLNEPHGRATSHSLWCTSPSPTGMSLRTQTCHGIRTLLHTVASGCIQPVSALSSGTDLIATVLWNGNGSLYHRHHHVGAGEAAGTAGQ